MQKIANGVSVDEVVLWLVEEAWKANERKPKKPGPRPDIDPLARADGERAGPQEEQAEFLNGLEKMHDNFRTACDIAKKFGVGRQTIDAIVQKYLEKSGQTRSLFRGIGLPNSAIIFGFLELGASPSVAESFLGDCCRNGDICASVKAARLIGRRLNGGEIGLLVDEYCNGASEFKPTEDKLMELAGINLGKEAAAAVAERLRKRSFEFNSHCGL